MAASVQRSWLGDSRETARALAIHAGRNMERIARRLVVRQVPRVQPPLGDELRDRAPFALC
jgi:hypothetical protein